MCSDPLRLHRGEIMRQSLEGLSTRIEKFINLLCVRGARPRCLHSWLCHHAHARQRKNQLLATAWINRSVNSCLASLFALQDERCKCVCKWFPEWNCIHIFVNFLPKKSLKCAAVIVWLDESFHRDKVLYVTVYNISTSETNITPWLPDKSATPLLPLYSWGHKKATTTVSPTTHTRARTHARTHTVLPWLFKQQNVSLKKWWSTRWLLCKILVQHFDHCLLAVSWRRQRQEGKKLD